LSLRANRPAALDGDFSQLRPPSKTQGISAGMTRCVDDFRSFRRLRPPFPSIEV
ncbi:unnamed protein product, partial [Prunus brigantina]